MGLNKNQNSGNFNGEVGDMSNYATKSDLETKVTKETNKSLVDNTLIDKLEDLENYDDSLIKEEINILDNKIDDKQDELISGSNIKTINGQSILGNGDITINEGENVDLSDYATKSDLETKVTKETNKSLVDNTLIDKLEDLENYDDSLIKEEIDSINSQLAHITKNIEVSVKDFGAKGDGETDDTQAFYDCISYAIENNKSVYVPKGVYILTHKILTFNLLDNQSFVMKGDGASSILKRKDNTVTEDWCGIFTFLTDDANTKDVEMIKIQDLKIDSNARNQMEPENSYDFEHCFDVRIAGKPNSRIKTVHIEGVYATDGVADHIYIAGSTDSYVDNFIVNNFQCDYRTRTRSDLCVTGYIKTAMFTNIKCVVLEYEFNNSEGLGDSYIFINNLEAERLDLAGIGIVCYATNMHIKTKTYLARVKGRMMNSSLTLGGDRFVNTTGLELNGCTFYAIKDSEGTIYPVKIEHQNILDFRNCYFKIKGDVEVYDGVLLDILPLAEGMQINIDNCEFDSRAQTAIRADRCGTISVSNCKFYNYYPLMLAGSKTYTLNVTLNNLMMLGEGYSLNITGGNITSLVINNMISNEKNAPIESPNSSCDKFGELFVDRKIIISSPLTVSSLREDINKGEKYMYLFNGDTFVNKNSLPNEPRCWRATKTSRSYNLSETLNIVAINEGIGTTEERPTCYLSMGYQYFDTTLGKLITWNGSSWVE